MMRTNRTCSNRISPFKLARVNLFVAYYVVTNTIYSYCAWFVIVDGLISATNKHSSETTKASSQPTIFGISFVRILRLWMPHAACSIRSGPTEWIHQSNGVCVVRHIHVIHFHCGRSNLLSVIYLSFVFNNKKFSKSSRHFTEHFLSDSDNVFDITFVSLLCAMFCLLCNSKMLVKRTMHDAGGGDDWCHWWKSNASIHMAVVHFMGKVFVHPFFSYRSTRIMCSKKCFRSSPSTSLLSSSSSSLLSSSSSSMLSSPLFFKYFFSSRYFHFQKSINGRQDENVNDRKTCVACNTSCDIRSAFQSTRTRTESTLQSAFYALLFCHSFRSHNAHKKRKRKGFFPFVVFKVWRRLKSIRFFFFSI